MFALPDDPVGGEPVAPQPLPVVAIRGAPSSRAILPGGASTHPQVCVHAGKRAGELQGKRVGQQLTFVGGMATATPGTIL